jgi:hypothetical protein
VEAKNFSNIMKELRKEVLSTLLKEYHDYGYKSQKPLMLWIGDVEIYNDLKSKLRHQGYVKADCLSQTEYEKAKGIFYFTSIPAVLMYDLKYGAEQSCKHQIPYICLMQEGTHLMHSDIRSESHGEIDKKSRLYMEEKFDNYLIK